MYHLCETLDHLHYDWYALEMEFEMLFCFDEFKLPVVISTHHMEYIIPFTTAPPTDLFQPHHYP